MASQVIKLHEPEGMAREIERDLFPQRKRSEVGRFLLQVDSQTKRSFATADAAETAGMAVKKGYPVVQVAVYDSVESLHKLIDLPQA
jgi:hypothetical protein